MSEAHSPKPAAAERPSVLVIDDEPMLAEAVVRALRQAELEVESASDGEKALGRLAARRFDLVLTDLSMPGKSGMDVLEEVKARWPGTEVVMMTGHSTVDTAVQAMKKGAFEFLQKPFESLDHVVLTARRALERGELRAQNAELLSRLRARPSGLIGSSPAMRAIEGMIPDLARSDAPVLIEGESGTGKEVLARAIHGASPRAAKPFVPVNCGAIPETMLESELFGHEKGAFTGAITANKGLFRAADKGTLFLDEIGEIAPAMQVKLLRALQEQEVRAVGSTQTVKIDVRVIAATNRDLHERISKGAFREDLYYRLAVVPVKLPPLRDRPEDIALLTRHFVKKGNAAEPGGQPKFDEIDPAVMDRLMAWSWPGNVRELENVVERAFALGKPGRLTLSHLPEEMARAGGPAKIDPNELSRIPLSLDAFEKFCLQRALEESGGDAGRAASLLGLPRSTFYRRLQRVGLKAETSRK